MSLKSYRNGLLLFVAASFVCGCAEKKQSPDKTAFTKIDSLTDTYLALQDSMLWAWNMMINDDNIKIKAMHNLAHRLMVVGKSDKDDLISLEQRLEQLSRLRYSQKTIANEDLVEEYDFASRSLISELTSIAESVVEVDKDSTVQKLVDEITQADQRVNTYREEYDFIAKDYNAFLDDNKDYLKDIDKSCSLDKRPLFQMDENNN